MYMAAARARERLILLSGVFETPEHLEPADERKTNNSGLRRAQGSWPAAGTAHRAPSELPAPEPAVS